ASSTSIVGAPVEVKPGGAPFVLTIEATDGLGRKARKTVQWKIDTPPVIVATPVLADAVCGTQYTETIQIVDGIPPFRSEE
ncbi:hypothetical protein NL462_27520, partial [Klebsiella pneumoniae]|nr:hypothetical protein [Klebsiella pneumoniae]